MIATCLDCGKTYETFGGNHSHSKVEREKGQRSRCSHEWRQLEPAFRRLAVGELNKDEIKLKIIYCFYCIKCLAINKLSLEEYRRRVAEFLEEYE